MHLARNERRQPMIKCSDAVEEEADLHNQIMEEIAHRGWLAFHGSMAHRAKRTLGEPDIVLLADAGRWFLIELKDREGKLSLAQSKVHAHASSLSHTIHTIRSMSEFLELTKLQPLLALK
jgi:hypothetical protein